MITVTQPISPDAPEGRKRFSGAPWFRIASETKVTVGGAGGIGSWLTLFLSRMGTQVTLFDFDTVEELNLAGQFFNYENVGIKKTEAVKALVQSFGGVPPTLMETFDEKSEITPICFAGFDNMATRHLMFQKWKALEAPNKMFIDGRMAAEFYLVYAIKPENAEEFEMNELPTDFMVKEEPCSYKSTTHTAASCASDMVVAYTNHLTNISMGADVRETAFKLHKLNSLHGYIHTTREEVLQPTDH